MNNLIWQAEKKYYASVASGIVGRQIYVEDADEPELGYTGKENIIYIAKSHSLYKTLNERERRIIQLGITVHESLHQVFTDFTYYEECLKQLNCRKAFCNYFEAQIFHDLVNIVEDPAIENMASQIVGGPALKALEFTIAKIDELLGNFDVGCAYPFEEVVNALVQFGDVGIIHGTFHFLTSKKIFKDISPLFYEAINEPDAKKRIDMTYPIFQILRKLWAGYSDSKLSELSKRMRKIQNEHGNSPMNGSGSGSGSVGRINPASTKNKKRKATIRKISNEEYTNLSAQATNCADTGGDIELLYCDDTDALNSKESISSKTEGKLIIENPFDLDADKTDVKQNKSEKTKDVEIPAFIDKDNPEDNLFLQSDPVPELSPEDYRKILDAIFQENNEMIIQQEEMKKYYADIPSFSEIAENKNLRDVSAVNTYVDTIKQTDEMVYDKLVEEMSDGISIMSEELRNIFYNDRARKFFTDSGRVNLKRFASGKVTTRLFERKTLPGNKMDMCIGIAGDLSGSMKGSKLLQEKLAMIALAETFAEFTIPLYFMGFNVLNHTPVQTHYIRWENSRFERERLLHLKADGNNFDSYSIRYMSHLMKERTEAHKLMFILSDGAPSFYFSKEDGIKENILAIQEAKSQRIDVVGIGIGESINISTFTNMYGKDFFLHVTQPQDLFSNLANVITAIVMRWN